MARHRPPPLRPLLFAVALLGFAPVAAQAQEAATTGDEAAEDAQAMMTDESAIDDQAAREFFTAGSNLYELGRYHDAAIQFQQAYDLSERPALLYNIYLAHRDASEQREAAAALRLYLEQMPDAHNHQALTVRLQNLERGLAEQDAAEAAAAASAEEAVRREHAEEERREAEERALAEDNKNIIPWIIAGSGGAILLVGVVTGIITLGLASSVDENLDRDCFDAGGEVPYCASPTDTFDKMSARSAFATATDVLLIAGGIVAAAGLTWGLIRLAGDSDDEAAPTVSAMCGPTGCGASMRMGF